MAANKMDEILKHFPDLEEGWKEMEERFKKDQAEKEMLSLKYQQMLERERLKENLPEPEFTKTKKAETTSKVTSKVTAKVAFKVSDDLEKAAKRYATEGDEISGLYIIDEEVDAFIAGAKWQKQQILDCNTTLQRTFELGKQEMKQQMMAKAVDGKIYETQARSKLKAATTGKISSLDYKVGDTVKIIVIKKDEL